MNLTASDVLPYASYDGPALAGHISKVAFAANLALPIAIRRVCTDTGISTMRMKLMHSGCSSPSDDEVTRVRLSLAYMAKAVPDRFSPVALRRELAHKGDDQITAIKQHGVVSIDKLLRGQTQRPHDTTALRVINFLGIKSARLVFPGEQIDRCYGAQD